MCTACGSYDKEIQQVYHAPLTEDQIERLRDGEHIFASVTLRMEGDLVTQEFILFSVRLHESPVGGGWSQIEKNIQGHPCQVAKALADE